MFMNTFLSHLKSVLVWLSDNWKAISAIIAAILALATGVAVTSCGSSVKAVIRTADSANGSTVTITTNNPTTVSPTVNPNTNPTITISPK